MQHAIRIFLLVTSAFYSILVMGSQKPGAGDSRKRSADQLAPEETQPEKKQKKSSTPEQQTQFFTAIEQDNLNAVVTHLTEFPEDIDLRTGGFNSTPLIKAIFYRAIKVFPVLFTRTSDDKLEAVDSKGQTALYHAADLEAFEGQRGREGFRVINGATEMLLERGANANSADNEENETPLMLASVYTGDEIIKLLLDYGADPNEQNSDGDTAFTLMLDNISSEMDELLVDNPNSDHYKSLHEDVYTSIQLLLDHGMNVNAMVGNPPIPLLFKAIEMGIYEAVETLIARGADIGQGQTALERAQLALERIDEQSEHNQMQKIIQLLSNPLKLAILQGNLPAVQKIIEESPLAVHTPDEEGDTPLMFAIRFKNMAIKPSLEIIKALIRARTNLDHRNEQGWNAETTAILGYEEVNKFATAQNNKNYLEFLCIYKQILDLLAHPLTHDNKIISPQLISQCALIEDLAAIIHEYQVGPSSCKPALVIINKIKTIIRTDNLNNLIASLDRFPEGLFAADENKDTLLSLAIKYEKPLALEIIMQIIKDKVPLIIEGIDTRIAQLTMQMKFGRIDRYAKLIKELDEKKDKYRNVLNELESSELRELAQTVENRQAKTEILNIIDHYNPPIVPMDVSEPASSSSAAPIEPMVSLPNDFVQSLIMGGKHGHETIVNHIYDQPELLKGVDKHGNTPIMIAAEHANVNAVAFLIAESADKKATNNAGKNALMLATESLAIASEPARRARLEAIRKMLSR